MHIHMYIYLTPFIQLLGLLDMPPSWDLWPYLIVVPFLHLCCLHFVLSIAHLRIAHHEGNPEIHHTPGRLTSFEPHKHISDMQANP